VVAHLGESGANRDVSLYATVDGVRRQLATGTVDDDGNLTASLVLTEPAAVTAVFLGDEDYSSRAVLTPTLGVRPKVGIDMRQSYCQSGSYAEYHVGQHAVTPATVTPGRQGQCVRFRVQHLRASGWHTFRISGCQSLTSATHAWWVTRAYGERGSLIRVRAVAPADGKYLLWRSTWAYAPYTR
jgi:hypothetical protein